MYIFIFLWALFINSFIWLFLWAFLRNYIKRKRNLRLLTAIVTSILFIFCTFGVKMEDNAGVKASFLNFGLPALIAGLGFYLILSNRNKKRVSKNTNQSFTKSIRIMSCKSRNLLMIVIFSILGIASGIPMIFNFNMLLLSLTVGFLTFAITLATMYKRINSDKVILLLKQNDDVVYYKYKNPLKRVNKINLNSPVSLACRVTTINFDNNREFNYYHIFLVEDKSFTDVNLEFQIYEDELLSDVKNDHLNGKFDNRVIAIRNGEFDIINSKDNTKL